MKVPLLLILALAMFLLASPLRAQPPTSGMPVPELSFMDDIIHAYMDTTDAVGIVLGVSSQGQIIFWRGYGWSDADQTIAMQETATMRVASITKTFTTAVIIDLIDRGMLGQHDWAFDLDQPGGGILNLEPFPELIDERFKGISVYHLLHHKGGWDRDIIPDPTSIELQIQDEMGLAQLPSIEETMRWALGQQLQHMPGSETHYANIGYLALGLIAEQVSGTDILSYVRTHLLTDDLWYPSTDLFMGRTFAADQDPREPYYNYPYEWVNVFDPDGPLVLAPYGGWNHELKDGYGRMVANAIPLLQMAHHYYLNGEERGQPIGTNHASRNHGGALFGASSKLRQRDDGIDFVIMVNSYVNSDRVYASEISGHLDDALDAINIVWPTETVDCRWFDFAHTGQEKGSFDFPYGSINDLGNIPPYSKIKFKPGSSPWTGVITRGHLALSATQEGSVVIGQ